MSDPTTEGTVLVVDDCQQLRELIEVLLIRSGHRVLTAANGAEALAIAREARDIDLLLSDVEMPVMNGGKLAEHFVKLHPTAPVLFVSSSDERVATTVPFEFLLKPFTIAHLRDAVGRALRKRQSSPAVMPSTPTQMSSAA